MEIVTWVVSGALEHRDSTGGGSVLRPGDVQRMTAGKGVTHSEYNHSADEPLRLLQIWILPAEKGLEPGYVEKHFPEESRRNQLCLIVSPDGEDESVDIHQDVRIHASLLDPGTTIEYSLAPGRRAWVQMIDGKIRAGTVELVRGDGLAVDGEPHLKLEATERSQFLLFDLG
jgi:redox-sensitive bicupin YhaK (pirin superfamily)